MSFERIKDTDTADVALYDKVNGMFNRVYSEEKTNCITEIPQDIKLELSNRTLTLKGGSKVTYLDGTTQTISSDVSTTGVSFAGECFVLYVNGVLDVRAISQVSSGTSTPTSAVSGKYLYFNTSTKKVYEYRNNQWIEHAFSLPLGTITLQTSSPYIKSFDKTFNGFGYFGSTVFALPGVKGLIPNGWNEDGSLKNIEVINNSILINTFSESRDNWKVYLENTAPITLKLSSAITYLKDVNRNYYDATNAYIDVCCLGSVENVGSLNISNFTPKTTFHALDYNDKPEIITWGMPDYTTSVTWTCPIMGSTYTVPYDCELYFSDFNNGPGKLLINLNKRSGVVIMQIGSSNNTTLVSDRIKLKKGTVLYIGNNRQCTVSLITKLYGV